MFRFLRFPVPVSSALDRLKIWKLKNTSNRSEIWIYGFWNCQRAILWVKQKLIHITFSSFYANFCHLIDAFSKWSAVANTKGAMQNFWRNIKYIKSLFCATLNCELLHSAKISNRTIQDLFTHFALFLNLDSMDLLTTHSVLA